MVHARRTLFPLTFFSSKLDLLVRVRYANPLPAPPCPPKLLDIPTNPTRYARPEFLNALADDTPLPMIVDAECGMPLDLGKWDCLWEEGADDSGPLSIPCLLPVPLSDISLKRSTPIPKTCPHSTQKMPSS